ncbi:TATA box-binding protein-associated factor RNA polymerase I subunit C-like isoform X2 [Myxocyprinus asiaticus]|uniref:TATA box-binding protein-associated factor RNA polymerase I subunit C-like isoform X2 n=1 Tax=Myxocyprinus asiaticus TaxID=70543 RepID=UPI00222160FF|nr:TATA box-binding protein-associated factor RNA polymerase I subunit C-like isoform X2 [Myxocyprinus asiaticus]XP_051536318.1 TATA box-binding protein-associated factor RNA polymerase I subunit C-like isoform X2 [Myxocyprinus asiaticus]
MDLSNHSGRVDFTSSNMDSRFPDQHFPHFYLDGPPENMPRHSLGGWGSYDRVFEIRVGQCDAGQSAQREFVSQHTVKGEEWVPVKPAVTPLIPPCKDAKVLFGPPPDPMDFPEHMQYYYQHYCMDAFSTMGNLLCDNFTFKKKNTKCKKSILWAKKFLKTLNYKRCHVRNYWQKVRQLHYLVSDVVSDIPPSLLAEHLHEELTSQREQLQFCSDLTGGAVGYMPLYEAQGSAESCLIYPSGDALEKLNFHRVVPEFNDDKPPNFLMDSSPFAFELKGTIKQLSLGNMEDQGNVGVRSDYFCGSWVLGGKIRPRLQEVIQSNDRYSCITVSPHVPDELVVATEYGAAYLWTVKKGLQKFREEDSNLYFNAKSPWRWCEFTCHPRVMVYADRTGAEITDARNRDCYQTLFRIGKTAACVRGERVLLAKYLSESHAHHHLITSQWSAYIMDERVPCVPVLKWDHMMESEPVFACSLPALSQSKNCKVLLGSQRSQDIMLLQYTGGRMRACQARGPIQKLFSPRESLSHLNLLLPHKRHLAEERLNVPAAGLTAVQNKDYLSVFQLTETGDLFFQTLKLHTDETTTNNNLPEPASSSVSVEHTKEPGLSENLQSNTDNDNQGYSESEIRQRALSQLEVIDNVENGHSPASDTNEDISKEPNGTCSKRQPIQRKDHDLQVAWNKWLKPIFTKVAGKKRHLHHHQIKTRGLIKLKMTKTDKLNKDRPQSLRRDLQEVMKKKQLLLHGATHLPLLNVTPVPYPVDPNEWPDDLSQRLTASWDGEWKSWWEEKLGLNREKKMEALRRKRRREKKARAWSRTSLSGSFTSSVSYQDDLSGYSSAPSQGFDSDGESLGNSQAMEVIDGTLETEMHRKSPVIMRQFLKDQTLEQEPVESASRSPWRRSGPEQDSSSKQPTLGSSSSLDVGLCPASATLTQRPKSQSKLHNEDYLNSLFGSQEPTQEHAEQEGGFSFSQVPTASQLSLSSRRISQVRGSAQAPQPKKKSRMGF